MNSSSKSYQNHYYNRSFLEFSDLNVEDLADINEYLFIDLDHMESHDDSIQEIKDTSVINLTDDEPGITIQYKINDSAKIFESELHQYRYNQKKLVARAFCQSQNGLQYLQQYIKQYSTDMPINPQKFDTLAKTVVIETYTKLEKFLIQTCFKNIIKKSPKQKIRFYSLLLKFRKQLNQKETQTFLKILKSIYGLQDIILTQKEALDLYNTIQDKTKGFYQAAESQMRSNMDFFDVQSLNVMPVKNRQRGRRRNLRGGKSKNGQNKYDEDIISSSKRGRPRSKMSKNIQFSKSHKKPRMPRSEYKLDQSDYQFTQVDSYKNVDFLSVGNSVFGEDDD